MDSQGKKKKRPAESTAQTVKRPIQPGDGADEIAKYKAKREAEMNRPVQPEKPKKPLNIITEDTVRDAMVTLQKYKSAKTTLETKIRDNELWYRLRHGSKFTSQVTNNDGTVTVPNASDPDVSSAWLLNAIMNKHADAMDNFPTVTVLPREPDDQEFAKSLTGVLPAVLEQNEFESVYSDVWWYKLKMGTGVYQILWDNKKLNGIGDIAIRKGDLLNLYWEPGIRDLQQSHNLFNVEYAERDDIAAQYPQFAEQIKSVDTDVKQYIYDDSVPTDTKVAVVDWYYKRITGTKNVLHYCKFCCGQVLYASENDPDLTDRGWYDHGKYPFVFDVLFPEEGTPYGFGYIDVCKNPQAYIDKLDSIYVKHSAMSRPRFFARKEMNLNENDLKDFTKDIVPYEGNANPNDAFFPINVPPLDGNYLAMLDRKINEMKETSGNRDFSQGSTASGVTAASAIAALQEAGSKTSRDSNKASYRAFQLVCYMCIDLMRQFYTSPRYYRITGQQGATEFSQFNGQDIAMQTIPTDGVQPQSSRMPYFDLRAVAQKASPFSTVAQNERAKELFSMGFYRPDMADQALACLKMMQFEGIDDVRQTISQNGTMMDAITQLGPIALALAKSVDASQGTQYTQQVAALLQRYMAINNQPSAGVDAESQTNALGDALNGSINQTSGNARKAAASRSTPRA